MISRSVLAIATATLAFFAMHAKAQALAEFCPAQLAIQAVGSNEQTARGPASLFGIELRAFGARTVSARLAFDTDRGWFTADIPPVMLTEKDRHYDDTFGRITAPDWVSPVMYVRFATNVRVAHSWVYSATARNDGDFGWEKTGHFICPPPAPAMELVNGTKTIGRVTMRRNGATRKADYPTLDARDIDQLRVSPTATGIQYEAKRSGQLETAQCANPFSDASMVRMTDLNFPDSLHNASASGLVGIEIALKDDGVPLDSWVWASSGYPQLDATALLDVQQSTFHGAVAYCHAVPAFYYFFADFESS